MAFTYSIVDSFSIAFLLILFFSTKERFSRLTETRCFRFIVLLAIGVLLCDMIAWQLDGQPGELNRYLLWWVNILCYLVSGLLALSWLYYTGLKLNSAGHITKLGWLLIALPYIVLVFASVMTPLTHWMFYIDEGNTYQRGALFAIQMVVPFGYIFAAALWALHRAGKERSRVQRTEYLYLSAFVLFPLVGGVLQLAIYGVSLAWPCTALSLMLVYENLQNHKISLDALTGLNNRGQLDKHLFTCFDSSENDQPFALFMLDIDQFKRINDEHGHTAGDAALIDAANILKRSLAGANAFLARYGGDEFSIVLHYKDDREVSELLSRIEEETEKNARTSTEPYKLVFSIGSTCFDRRRFSNYQDMINAADAQMYIQKRQHKACRDAVK